MNPSFLSLPDDWLALAWCLVTTVACLLLIQFATLIRPRSMSREVAPTKRIMTGRRLATRPNPDRSAPIQGVELYVAAYRLRFGNSQSPVHASRMRRRPWPDR
jgi:hypothetical protein